MRNVLGIANSFWFFQAAPGIRILLWRNFYFLTALSTAAAQREAASGMGGRLKTLFSKLDENARSHRHENRRPRQILLSLAPFQMISGATTGPAHSIKFPRVSFLRLPCRIPRVVRGRASEEIFSNQFQREFLTLMGRIAARISFSRSLLTSPDVDYFLFFFFPDSLHL